MVVGTGSRYRGDDGAGPLTIDMLKELQESEGDPMGDLRLTLIDADVVPENYTRPIRESGADAVLVVDAVEMGLPPGEIRLIPRDRIDAAMPCSHAMPMSHVMAYMNERIARVEMAGVQIRSAGLYDEVSEEVKEACSRLAGIIREGRVWGIPRYSKDSD